MHDLHSTYPVGTVIQTPIRIFGNDDSASGCIGVVYEHYQLGNVPGISIIFPNGYYDGFSEEEVKVFKISPKGFCKSCADYQFSNVMQLATDFKAGYFAAAL